MRLARAGMLGLLVSVAAAIAASTGTLAAAELYGLSPGTVELQSAGPLAFGPSNVLFVGDPMAAKLYALNTEDSVAAKASSYDISDLDAKLSSAFGDAKVEIVDLAVNPETGNAFLALTVGGEAKIAKVSASGEVTPLRMDKIGHAVANLPNPPEDKVVQSGRRSMNPRASSITDLAYTGGRVLVTGLAAGDSPSEVREFNFPFDESAVGTRVEIYHAAHGKREDYAPVQAFVPMTIGGEPSVLAGYTCTPLVKIPLAQLRSDGKVLGTTVAELGNRNRPLDMIVYEQNGKTFVLMANSARGVMKISTDGLESNAGLTEPVRGGGVAGQGYQTVESLVGVTQLDKLNDQQALVVIQQEGQPTSLRSVELP